MNGTGDDPDDGGQDTLNTPRRPADSTPGTADEGVDATHRGMAGGSGRATPGNPSDPISLVPGEKVGRYVLLDELGVGGMGVVFSAYDPELDRKVALKLLRTAGNDEARARLFREAQTLARLAHPNVVGVHDVGVQGNEVFVAMEFVPGVTLRALFKDEKAWERRLEALVGAGRGLAAAHEVGIVHRDFKPDNVLVAKSGLSRVLDFGLARAFLETPKDAARALDRPVSVATSSSSAIHSILGSVSGTPGYMAPEQYRGRETDARTDQFAFGICLYEALYGARPFSGGTLGELATSTEAGVTEPPSGVKGPPRWLWPHVRRALSPLPADRFPSMEALLEAITPRPPRRAAPLVAAGAVALALGLVAVVLGKAQFDARSVCDAAGVKAPWERERLSTRFQTSTLPYAADAWRSTSRALDSYADALALQGQLACRAARIEHRDSDALYDARRLCLARRRAAFTALVEVLSSGGETVIAKAPEAAGKLPLVSDCADEAKVLSAVPEPTPSQAPAVSSLRAALSRAQALESTALYAEGVTLLREQLPLAESAGHRPTLAALLVALGSLERQAGEGKAAETTLKRAMQEALASNDRESIALACLHLAQTIGDTLGRPLEAMPYTAWAQGALDALPGSELLQSLKDLVTGNLYVTAGDATEAEKSLRRSYELRKKKLGERHLDTGIALASIGIALFHQSKYDESIEASTTALGIYLEVLGPNHPRVASIHGNLAIVIGTKGDLKGELAHQQLALAINEKALGPEHPAVALTLANLAAVLSPLGRYEDALTANERATAIRKKTLGEAHYLVGQSLSASAAFLRQLDRYPEALEKSQQSIVVLRKTEADPSYLASALTGQGSLLRSMKRPSEAVPLLEEAVKILETMGEDVEETDLAVSRMHLALALTAVKAPRPRVIVLAQQAKAVLAKAAEAHTEELEQLETLLR